MSPQQPGYSQGLVSANRYAFQSSMVTASAAGPALLAQPLLTNSSNTISNQTTLALSAQHSSTAALTYSPQWNEHAVVPFNNDMSGSGAGSSPTLASGQTGGNPNSKTIGGKRPNGGVKSGGVRKSRSGSANPPAKSASPDDDENDDSSEEMDEKRRKFLERNRVAASKCRQKKKMWIKELERRAEDATMQNRTLHLAVAQLKEEVIILKTQLLAHRNCGCNAIQQYLQADCGDPLTHAAVASATVPLPQPMPGTIMQDPAAAAAAAVVAAAATGFPLATQPASLTQQGPPPQPRQPSMQSFVAGGNSAFIEQTHPSASPNPGGQSATSLTATPALNSSVFGKSLNDVNVP